VPNRGSNHEHRNRRKKFGFHSIAHWLESWS
jgi:hypothetical protein